jgi:hypothetical protein
MKEVKAHKGQREGIIDITEGWMDGSNTKGKG